MLHPASSAPCRTVFKPPRKRRSTISRPGINTNVFHFRFLHCVCDNATIITIAIENCDFPQFEAGLLENSRDNLLNNDSGLMSNTVRALVEIYAALLLHF